MIVCALIIWGGVPSLTEYTPKLYNFARTIDATNASENATYGVNAAAKATNKAQKALNLRCKLAGPANFDFAIGLTSLTMPQSHVESGKRRSDFAAFEVYSVVQVATTRLAGHQRLPFEYSLCSYFLSFW